MSRRLIALAFLLALRLHAPCSAYGAPDHDEVYDTDAPGYDETSVFLNVQRIGGTEMQAIVHNGIAYLSVTAVFDFLKIRNTPAPGLDSVTGVFISPQAAFVIDKVHNRIRYQGKVMDLKEDDLIRTETGLYLKLDYFSPIFGLTCLFDFRNLTIKMSTMQELPAAREIRQEQIRHNISRLKGVVKADTTIGRSYPFFHAGTADWSVIAMQEQNGLYDTKASLAVGGILAGGETNIALNYLSNVPFSEKQQFYQWRYADNSRTAMKQAVLGKINPQSVSSIYSPVVGIQLTNTPTTTRQSYGTYTLSDVTEPGWVVELYVNNVLIDYCKADASGFFSFNVPLVYGNSVVRLRFYSPWGEERSRVAHISIPFNFVPKDELEYTLSAGVVEDDHNSRYGRLNMNYGLSNHLTAGGGMEYLSSVTSGRYMPFATASLRLTSGLLLSGEYTYGVRARGILSYRLPSNIQLDLNYTRYTAGQKAIIYNYLEERRGVLSVPFHYRSLSVLSRLSFNQTVLPGNTKYTTGEWVVAGGIGRLSANISTNMVAIGKSDPVTFEPYVYSNISLAWQLPKGFLLTPQAQYAYRDREFISVKCGLEKLVFRKCFLSMTYEQNFKSGISSIGGSLRYDLSFGRLGVSARRVNNSLSLVQSAQGSLIHDGRTHYFGAGSQPAVGRAGIAIRAYLDYNGNNKHDAGEPAVPGLKIQINSGHVTYSEHDTIIRILDLEPYTSHYLTLSTDFENLAWQLHHKSLNVITDPNRVKLIQVPVAITGEASGKVLLKSGGSLKGLEQIRVCFYQDDTVQTACAVTEPDGFFSLIGLAPGHYTLRADSAQLARLHLKAASAAVPVHIRYSREGDVAEGLQLILEASPATPVPAVQEAQK